MHWFGAGEFENVEPKIVDAARRLSHLDEFQRRNWSFGFVRPANQSFDPKNDAVVGTEEWLVLKAKPPIIEGPAELGRDVDPALARRFESCLVHLGPAAAVALHGIEGKVRVVQREFRSRTLIRHESHSDACGDIHFASTGLVLRRDCLHNPIGDVRRPLGVGVAGRSH